MKSYKYLGTLFLILTLTTLKLFAQDKEAKITLEFVKGDSINVCKAYITSQDSPVKEINVKLYVKRLYSLLPVGEGSSDEDGIVSFEFPNDIPGDKEGNLGVVAKIEDDENYMNTETKSDVKWGVPRAKIKTMERSLSDSRAPIFFIVVASTIITGIWGTLIFVVFQVWRKRKPQAA